MSKNVNILDCTLRDGGYYTDWDFPEIFVKSLVKSLDHHGVNIIELGYKSPKLGGPYRKCNDGFISSIINFPVMAKLAFMIDAKDYIDNGKVNKDLLFDVIKEKANSPFDVCRIAIKIDELRYLDTLNECVTSLGYDVFCNLMTASILSAEQINNFVSECKRIGINVKYVADSYGSLTPYDVRKIFASRDIEGIHTHDNMGLAFANCLEAERCGATYLDGTLLGMGRGVGNVKTEQLLQDAGTILPSLLDCIDMVQEMKDVYKWGQNPLYMMAGKHTIHPLYVQDLNGSNLSNESLIKSLNSLKGQFSYDPSLLDGLKEQRAVVVIPARYKSSRFPGKPLAKINGKEMILHVAEKAEQAVGKDNVYVATENSEIAVVVRKNGYKVVITSDKCLTGTDRVAEAAKEIEADIFVNVQGDEPMIDPGDINRAINLKKRNPNHVINCMSAICKEDNPEDRKIPKVICDLDGNLVYCSRNVLPGNKSGKSKNVYKQVCIYAFDRKQLNGFRSDSKTPLESQEDIEIVRFLEKSIPVKMLLVDNVSYAVDYLEDVSVVERLLKDDNN
jgi:3-deoxy-manno-octulosonate cytidylyltransferase (CMP-KDO synthetase)